MAAVNLPRLIRRRAIAGHRVDPHTLKKPIPVIATLDNGETYKGLAFEVRPNGLVMVRTGNCDLGVQLSSINRAASANVAENDI